MLEANRPYGAQVRMGEGEREASDGHHPTHDLHDLHHTTFLLSQGVADMLAQYGLKKTGVTRSLDSLAASGKLTVKVRRMREGTEGRGRAPLAPPPTHPPPHPTQQEFGKSRIYWAPQSTDAGPDPAAAAALAAQKARLQDAVTAAAARAAKLKAALAAASAGPSPAEVSERLAAANAALPDLQKRVAALRGDSSAPRVCAADMAAAQKKAADAVSAWAKRRAAFKECWDAITENMDRNPKSLFDEIGVETDEAAGVCLADVRAVVGTAGGVGNKMRKT